MVRSIFRWLAQSGTLETIHLPRNQRHSQYKKSAQKGMLIDSFMDPFTRNTAQDAVCRVHQIHDLGVRYTWPLMQSHGCTIGQPKMITMDGHSDSKDQVVDEWQMPTVSPNHGPDYTGTISHIFSKPLFRCLIPVSVARHYLAHARRVDYRNDLRVWRS